MHQYPVTLPMYTKICTSKFAFCTRTQEMKEQGLSDWKCDKKCDQKNGVILDLTL